VKRSQSRGPGMTMLTGLSNHEARPRRSGQATLNRYASAMHLPFRILNVFAIEGDRLSGNPLCVFEDGSDLSEIQMQALARQMNLSETTFLLPAAVATATRRVRIFTPNFEMPFAGHPSLGSAAVIYDLLSDITASSVILEMAAGLVPVTCRGDVWTLRTARPPTHREVAVDRATIAEMVGVPEHSIVGAPQWVNTGAEQLLIPLCDAAAVESARPHPALLAVHGNSELRGESMAYLWAPNGEDEVVARFFFLSNGAVIEDPATGSACANLGGWYLAQQAPVPLRKIIRQGTAVGRPSRLELTVDSDGAIFVAGTVIELGRGTLEL
jgi:trans-2,3-dihydro-3-hydroxyanthranilate isomerase